MEDARGYVEVGHPRVVFFFDLDQGYPAVRHVVVDGFGRYYFVDLAVAVREVGRFLGKVQADVDGTVVFRLEVEFFEEAFSSLGLEKMVTMSEFDLVLESTS